MRAAEIVAAPYAAGRRAADGRAAPSACCAAPSGKALLFIRLYERTGNRRYLDAAEAAIAADLDRCVTDRHGALQVDDGRRTLPYLGGGSGGIGMVIDQFAAHRGNEAFADAARGIRLAANSGLYIQAGLFNGRAGMIACLASTRDAGHAGRAAGLRRPRTPSAPMSTGWPGMPSGTAAAWRSPVTCCCASRWTWAPAPPASCWARPPRSPHMARRCRSSPGPQASLRGRPRIAWRPFREPMTVKHVTRR